MLFATYLYLPGDPTGEAIQLLDLAALPTLADYYVRLLGLPWSHAASLVWFGRIVGCIVLGASILTLFHCMILRRSIGRLERIGLALLLFSLLAIAMVAVGRWYWTQDRPVSVRYTIYVALLEAGLLLANTPWLNGLWQKGHRRPVQWAMLGAATVLLVQQVAAGQAAVEVTTQYKNSYRQFVAGQQGDATDRPVFYGSAAERERVLQIIRRLGIYQN
jgi:phosphate/sulfate permease